MSALTSTQQWKALADHAASLRQSGLKAAQSSHRDDQSLVVDLDGFVADFTRGLMTPKTRDLLLDLARATGLEAKRSKMFAGDPINNTENRAVLHTALRARPKAGFAVAGQPVMPDIHAVLARMEVFANALRGGTWTGHTGKPITDVVNIGIGGSDLGPYMIYEALKHNAKTGGAKTAGPRVHFVSNVDGAHLSDTLEGLNPETTLFIVTSKTFTTQETMMNAASARAWLLSGVKDPAAVSKHFVAVSTNAKAVQDFGIDPANMFGFWDWVGGRFSLWSAVGLSICAGIGYDGFEELLAGAQAMDSHFETAPLDRNIPVLVGLSGIFYRNFLDCASLAVLPYAQRLNLLPAYLQQLEMESNGKSVDRDGHAVDYHTAPVIFGQAGTNGQHAFYQLLHQGTQIIPADFIELRTPCADAAHHEVLNAHLRAQVKALSEGQTLGQARAKLAPKYDGAALDLVARHSVFDGGRPAHVFSLPRLDARALGMLVAMYEHKVFVQGAVWNLNSFDQWGVQLGKDMAADILARSGAKPKP